MKIIELTEAIETLATYASAVAQEPVIITIGGQPIAALMAIENADLETVSLSINLAFLALIERSRARHKDAVHIAQHPTGYSACSAAPA